MKLAILILIFAACMIIIWALSVRARSKDETSDMDTLVRSAETGDPVAQYNLAVKLYEGQAVERDPQEAAKWFMKVAENGHVEAQFRLGAMFSSGFGVEKNEEEASKWYRMAADQGHLEAIDLCGSLDETTSPAPAMPGTDTIDELVAKANDGDRNAQYNLGIIFYNGQGVDVDFMQASSWFLQAAHKGDLDAQYNLGLMFGRGEGVEKNINESVKWFKEAAEGGHQEAQTILDQMYKKGS